MARIESIAVAGYYPAPARLLSSFASTLRLQPPEGPEEHRGLYPVLLLDPCAGEGHAIEGLRAAWEAQSTGLKFRTDAYELEGQRAAALRERLGRHQATQADAFCMRWGYGGAAILWLNPPYDTDPVHGRLEHRFLLHFTSAIAAGDGYLMFLVPGHALAASADHLSREFTAIRCWRLPEPEYLAYKQVLLVGRRLSSPLSKSAGAEKIRGWARDPDSLPVLEERCSSPVIAQLGRSYKLDVKILDLDVASAATRFRPWSGTGLSLDQQVGDLMGAKITTVLPPKPAHIALALAAGQFNGRELEPNDPNLHPPILAKGVFRREHVTIEQKKNKKGEVTATILAERPKLELSVLDTETYEYHPIAPGVTPSRSADLSKWTAADVVLNYDRSLAELLKRQFPPLHDPTDPTHEFALPKLARTPFPAQGHAIRAGIKLLANGENPFFDAEVGSGKTIMSLYLVAALSPTWREQTRSELQRLGLKARLPVVRRTLIVCPPHLLTSWQKQILATLPAARVQIIKGLDDIDREADFYVLSRESAKLGHGLKSVGARCPGCGAYLFLDEGEIISKRLRCPAKRKAPSQARDPKTGARKHVLADLARSMAVALRPALGANEIVQACLPYRLRERPAGNGAIRMDVLADVLGGLLQLIGRKKPDSYSLVSWIGTLATTLGARESVADVLAEVKNPDYACQQAVINLRKPPTSWSKDAEATALLTVLEQLRANGTWTKTRCGEPLFAPTAPRRYPLAKYILKRRKHRFDAIILDEVHEFSHATSAQSKAAHRLTTIPGVPTIALSGSPCNGYASSMFHMWHALSGRFRQEFERTERTPFVRRYGYEKLIRDEDVSKKEQKKRKDATTFGSQSDRELSGLRVIGEAPGVAPTFVIRHILPSCVILHKADIEKDLPPMTERPVPLMAERPEDQELLEEYRRLQTELLKRIRSDRFDPDRAGKLLGALLDLPSYLDRCTEDLPPYVVKYPEELDGEVIATAKMFPRSWRTPKERMLIAELRQRLAAGERCLVFVSHTQSGLAQRVVRLIEKEVSIHVAYLDAAKVNTAKREAWIEDQLDRRGIKVLVTNPATVKTGLNVLVSMSTAIWHELDYSAQTWRQANGRLHRYGQKRPVSILLPYYANTAQQVAMELVAAKVSASLQCDGLDLQAALEAAGAIEPDASMSSVLAIGEAVYRQLTGGSLGREAAREGRPRTAA